MMARIFTLLKLFRHDLIVMLLALKNSDTPKSVKGLLVAALLYFLSPIDLVPDAVPLLGVLDDLVIVPMAVEGLMKLLPQHVRRDSEWKAHQVLRYAPAVLAVGTFFIVSWVILLIWGLVTLLSHIF